MNNAAWLDMALMGLRTCQLHGVGSKSLCSSSNRVKEVSTERQELWSHHTAGAGSISQHHTRLGCLHGASPLHMHIHPSSLLLQSCWSIPCLSIHYAHR
jgi:hypothetical protein